MIALAPGARLGTVHGKAAHAPVIVPKASPAGGGSVMTTPVAVEGPALLTTIVKVAGLPAVTIAGLPALVTCTSADWLIVVVSVAVSSSGVGSVVRAGAVRLAVWAGVPMAPGERVPGATKVAAAPAGRSTVVAMGPEPLAAPQTPASMALQVHVTAVSTAGNVSATDAPVTAL